MEWLRNEWYLQNWCKLWNAIPIKLIKSWNNLFQQTMAIRISEGKYNLNDLLHIKMSLKWVHRPWSPVPTIRLIFIYCIFATVFLCIILYVLVQYCIFLYCLFGTLLLLHIKWNHTQGEGYLVCLPRCYFMVYLFYYGIYKYFCNDWKTY